ncbi:hypothetical protein EVAR_2790_1 [Eumeta japonica]|uniref:Uncharacterized protein n=1 Tax=Eumeta variegata TaxID=151549 RepID=A0A4C1T0L7_EUMVA|nr:hypothetical protein EVAR_2790_1 [Eumeta japonica]
MMSRDSLEDVTVIGDYHFIDNDVSLPINIEIVLNSCEYEPHDSEWCSSSSGESWLYSRVKVVAEESKISAVDMRSLRMCEVSLENVRRPIGERRASGRRRRGAARAGAGRTPPAQSPRAVLNKLIFLVRTETHRR